METEIKEIKYGRRIINGELHGYACYKDEQGNTIELISPPYGDLKKLVNGKPSKVKTEDIMTWTRIAGWIGTDELLNALRIKRE